MNHTDLDRENQAQEVPILLGIDGGGTKCKAVLMDQDNNVLGIGISGPGNPFYGVEQAQKSIVESATKALQDASKSCEDLKHVGLNEISAGIGLAGVNIPHMYDLMEKWQSPFKTKYITTDLVIACLGAHNGHDGAVIVSGTGSCGFSYVNGVSKSVGGHGFPQGDKGSGAWFGIKAVEVALLSLDELGPITTIAHYICKELKVQSALGIVEKIASKPAAIFAQLAVTVFYAAKDKDQVAISIINEGASYLSNMAKLLHHPFAPPLSFIGGMAKSITPFLDDDLQQQFACPLTPPEVGAVFYARQQLAATGQISQTYKNEQ